MWTADKVEITLINLCSERARCHAGRRPPDRRDRATSRWPGTMRALEDEVAPGDVRHARRSPTPATACRPTSAARLRAVLHHQGGGQGDRPWPQHGLRLHPPVERPYRDRQRGRARHDRSHVFPAQRSGGGGRTGAAPAGHAAWQRSASWWSRTRKKPFMPSSASSFGKPGLRREARRGRATPRRFELLKAHSFDHRRPMVMPGRG